MHVFHTHQKAILSPKLQINGVEIIQVKNFNFLGVVINEHLNWKNHVEYISCKISRTNGILNRLKNYLPVCLMLTLDNSLILSHINYGILARGHDCKRILKLQ